LSFLMLCVDSIMWTSADCCWF